MVPTHKKTGDKGTTKIDGKEWERERERVNVTRQKATDFG